MTFLALACIAYLLCGLVLVIEELHWFFFRLDESVRQEIEQYEREIGITPIREEKLSTVMMAYFVGGMLWPWVFMFDDGE